MMRRVRMLKLGGSEDKSAVDDIADPPRVSTGKAKDGIIYRNDPGKTVRLDVCGRPYPVGADGFKTMKTTRPAGLTPEERNAIDVDEEGRRAALAVRRMPRLPKVQGSMLRARKE